MLPTVVSSWLDSSWHTGNCWAWQTQQHLAPTMILTRWIQVKAMMPYLKTMISVDEGEETISLETIETCMCALQRVNGKDKRLKYLWTGYGSRYQSHWFVSRTATLLGFSRSTVSPVNQEWSTTQRASSQLDTTVGSIKINKTSIHVENFGHLVESMPWRVETVLRAKGGGCNSILGRCS